MKISCDLNNNFFKIYNEAKGVAKHKNKIIKSKNINCLNYFEETIIISLTLIILSFLCLMLYLLITTSILILATFILLSVNCLNTIIIYSYRKEKSFKNTIVLDKEGLTDQSFQGIKMLFNWNLIEAIVIKRYSITILTNTGCFFYFDKEQEEKILKAVKKYHKDTLIIK